MISVIITAGGSSSRFNGINKLLYKINNKPVIAYSVELFNSLDFVNEIIISANEAIIDNLKEMFSSFSKVKIILGGSTRQKSVFNALKSCSSPDFVIIHDAARPFVTENIIRKCLENAVEKGACTAAVKTIDTIKITDNSGKIISSPDRNTLWNAQTPQIFKYDLILKLHEKYSNENYTDDSILLEKENIPVYVAESEYSNFKITTVDDIQKCK